MRSRSNDQQFPSHVLQLLAAFDHRRSMARAERRSSRRWLPSSKSAQVCCA